ncbi:MAG TPA: hypothetical protein VKV04_10805 [Verrucomicrobiae bacterium]|nr:hypothetical protein [Verrucomicrobiae bacterium]
MTIDIFVPHVGQNKSTCHAINRHHVIIGDKMKPLIQILGWCGFALILSGYIAVSARLVDGSSIVYQLINAGGAALIAVEAKSKKDNQPFWLNLFWFAVAAVTLLRLLMRG